MTPRSIARNESHLLSPFRTFQVLRYLYQRTTIEDSQTATTEDTTQVTSSTTSVTVSNDHSTKATPDPRRPSGTESRTACVSSYETCGPLAPSSTRQFTQEAMRHASRVCHFRSPTLQGCSSKPGSRP